MGEINNLLRIVTEQLQQQQQGQTAADDATAARVAATDAITSRERQPDVEPEALSRLQQILQGVASAGSTFAGGLNRNVQPQDFLQNINDLRQEQADSLNARSDRDFADEGQNLLLALQQATRTEDIALGEAQRQQQRTDAFSQREQDRGARIQGQQFTAEQNQLQRDFSAAQADEQRASNERIAGLRGNTDRVHEEAGRLAVERGQAILLGDGVRLGLLDQMRAAGSPEERKAIARSAVEAIKVLQLDEDLPENAFKTLQAIRGRIIDLATSDPDLLGIEEGDKSSFLLDIAVKGSKGTLTFRPEQFLARTLFGGE